MTYNFKMRNQGLNVLYVLLGINIFMFGLTYLYGVYADRPELYTFLALGAENLDLIAAGQVWRMVTAAFLHANLIHLVVNMYYLFQFGTIVERYFGGKKLFVTYIFTAITASAMSILITYIFGNPASISVGASGAIFGILGLIMVSAWKGERQHHTFGIPVDYRSLIPYFLISIALGFLAAGVNNAAHIGGFLGGAILGLIMKPQIGYPSGKQDVFEGIGFYIALLLAILSFVGLIVFNFQLTI